MVCNLLLSTVRVKVFLHLIYVCVDLYMSFVFLDCLDWLLLRCFSLVLLYLVAAKLFFKNSLKLADLLIQDFFMSLQVDLI